MNRYLEIAKKAREFSASASATSATRRELELAYLAGAQAAMEASLADVEELLNGPTEKEEV